MEEKQHPVRTDFHAFALQVFLSMVLYSVTVSQLTGFTLTRVPTERVSAGERSVTLMMCDRLPTEEISP
ncbi:hypothetical protein CesoFtcFv8_027251 [Champsocephalus esox]|uniref:Uncharacterized protein n=1 Tax=Champsocephalus esox TaxID=159716 RepID=A0AAN8G9G1_9TELE|nr:hypothetical protein CesoFtcFv8_027251 [Champsocephalus esox]